MYFRYRCLPPLDNDVHQLKCRKCNILINENIIFTQVSQSVAPAIVKSYAAAPAISYAAPSIGIAHGYAAPALSYAHAPALSYAHAPAYASYGSYIH